MATSHVQTLARRRLLALSAAVLLLLLLGPARAAEPVMPKSPETGRELFLSYCAGCHGDDATGNGPAAAALHPPPPDLTRITKRAGGTFPAARVVEIITYGGKIAAHSQGQMPVWGKFFSEEGGRGKIGAYSSRNAVVALKQYLESIQD